MTRLERKRRRVKTEKYVRLAAIIVILCVLFGGSFVYAKYFSESAQWGVAIASGVYFTANFAAESEEFFECNVTSTYQGGNDDFTFEVRNYENNLLFNESTVVIPYTVSFWLGETPVDGEYSVTIAGTQDSSVIGVGENNKVTFTNQSIAGGAAMANKYVIDIAVPGGSTHTPVPVYVLVETSEGSMIAKTLRGKMVLNNKKTYENYIDYQGFVIADGVENNDTAKFAYMQELSLFTYEIRTVGEVAEGDVTELLKLAWNPAVLEIDLFDEAYLAWLDSAAKASMESAGVVMDAQGLPTDESGRKYILMEVMPHSAQTAFFCRGEDFASVADMATLNAAISAEKYVETVNVGEETE